MDCVDCVLTERADWLSELALWLDALALPVLDEDSVDELITSPNAPLDEESLVDALDELPELDDELELTLDALADVLAEVLADVLAVLTLDAVALDALAVDALADSLELEELSDAVLDDVCELDDELAVLAVD